MTDRILHLSAPSHDEGETLYTITVGPTGEPIYGLIVTDERVKVICWPNQSDHAQTVSDLPLPDPDEARLEAAYDRAIESIPDRVELVHVHYDDKLSDKQIQSAFEGTDPYEDGNFDEFTSEARHNGMWSTIEYHVDEEDLDLLREDQGRMDDLRLAVQERDESDPFRALARNTPHRWMRYKLDLDANSIWSSDDEEINQDIANIAEALGIEHTPDVDTLLRELVTEAGGGRLNILWYGEVDELIDAAQLSDEHGNQVPQTITWENPHLLIHDGWNGAGHMVDYPGTITLPFERERLKLDARNIGNGYSWSDEIAGLAGDRGTTTVTITENTNINPEVTP